MADITADEHIKSMIWFISLEDEIPLKKTEEMFREAAQTIRRMPPSSFEQRTTKSGEFTLRLSGEKK